MFWKRFEGLQYNSVDAATGFFLRNFFAGFFSSLGAGLMLAVVMDSVAGFAAGFFAATFFAGFAGDLAAVTGAAEGGSGSVDATCVVSDPSFGKMLASFSARHWFASCSRMAVRFGGGSSASIAP